MNELNENRKNGSRSESSVEIDTWECGATQYQIDEYTAARLEFLDN